MWVDGFVVHCVLFVVVQRLPLQGNHTHFHLNNAAYLSQMNWTNVKASNRWSSRRGHALVSLSNHLYLIGGESCAQTLETSVAVPETLTVCAAHSDGTPSTTLNSDVWRHNGTGNWEVVATSSAFGRRAFFPAVVSDLGLSKKAIWIFGGGSPSCAYREIPGHTVHLCDDTYFSTDGGKNWTLVPTLENQWSPRLAHSAATHLDRFWIFGGLGVTTHAYPEIFHDVWYSNNPYDHWENVPQDWCSRMKGEACVGGWMGATLQSFQNQLWLLEAYMEFPPYGPTHGDNDIVRMTGGGRSKPFNTSSLEWKEDCERPSWSGRFGVSGVVDDDNMSLWVLGGSSSEVTWHYSTLLTGWENTTHLVLLPAFTGSSEYATYNASSAGGNATHWSVYNAPWNERSFHQSAFHDGSLWLVGGSTLVARERLYLALLNDVWVLNVSHGLSPKNPNGNIARCDALGMLRIHTMSCTSFALLACGFVSFLVLGIWSIIVLVFRVERKASTDTQEAVLALLDGIERNGSSSLSRRGVTTQHRIRIASDADTLRSSSPNSPYVPLRGHDRQQSLNRRAMDFDVQLSREFKPNWYLSANELRIGCEIGRGMSGWYVVGRPPLSFCLMYVT